MNYSSLESWRLEHYLYIKKIEISSHSGYWFSADINNFFSILLISLFSYFFHIFYPEVFFWAIMQRHNVFSFTKLTIFVFKKIAYVSKNQIHKKKHILGRTTTFTTKASDYVPKKNTFFTLYSLHRYIRFDVGASCK